MLLSQFNRDLVHRRCIVRIGDEARVEKILGQNGLRKLRDSVRVLVSVEWKGGERQWPNDRLALQCQTGIASDTGRCLSVQGDPACIALKCRKFRWGSSSGHNMQSNQLSTKAFLQLCIPVCLSVASQ